MTQEDRIIKSWQVAISLKSPADWSKPEKAQELVSILLGEDDFTRPQKYDDSRQPARYAFDASNLARLYEIWASDSGSLLLERRKPFPVWLSIWEWRYREFRQFNEIVGGFDERYFAEEVNAEKLLAFAKRLYAWGEMVHGYICNDHDWKAKNYFGKLTKVASGREVWTGGLSLLEGLPGIYWANFFGPKYVEFFGRDRFVTALAYRTEELPDGGFLLLTASSPLEYQRPEVRGLERTLIDHLGRDAFFDKSHPRRFCRVPEFQFEQPSFGGPIVVESYDPVSEAIPNPEAFIREAPALASALSRRFKPALDFSGRSLEQVDDFIFKKSYRRPAPWAHAEGRQLIQELVAYYGEVLRLTSGGRWTVVDSQGVPHPAIIFRGAKGQRVEFPFARVDKLWSERERADGLATRYYLNKSGQLDKLESYLEQL